MALIQKAFSDIITFSRSSNATRVGPDGLIQYAPHNLLLQSQTFDNASWTKSGSSVTANANSAPDGTVTGDKLIEDTSAGYHQTYQTASVTSGVVYTFSVYAKAAERTKLSVFVQVTGATAVTFDLSAGSYVIDSGSVTATITSVGNGWYRCSVTATATATGTGYFNVLLNNGSTSSYTGDGTSGIYIWGAQLAVGPYALDYTPTTSAAVYGPRFDYDGSGVTIVEPVSTNLFTYSEQFDNAAWAKASVTVSANSVVSPDGTTNADTLIPATNTADHDLYPLVTLTATSHTLSIYAKYSGYNLALSVALGGSIWAGCIFDLQNGVAKTPQGSNLSCTANIQNVGNGWYRCSITYTATSASWYQIISATNDVNATMGSYGFISFTGDGTSGIYLWGAQLEVGSTATGYMVSGATNGFRAVPVVSGSATARGLLVEEQRTNLLTYSEQFDNAAWTAAAASVIANAAASPDGTITAEKIVESASTAIHQAYQQFTTTVQSYTWSCYFKAAERTQCFIRAQATSLLYAYFDLTSGSVISVDSGLTATITSVGNGWYRCTATRTADATVSTYFVIGPASAGAASYAGNGTSGIYVWGAQFEAGSFATSYIPTLASTVTRSADVASVNTLSPWFNATEGTLFGEGEFISFGATGTGVVALGDGSSNENIGIYKASTSMYGEVIDGGVTQTSFSQSLGTGVFKSAFAYKANDFNMATNGAVGTTDTSGTIPTVTTMFLGAVYSGTSYPMNGRLRRIAYYPRRLTNAELQALSA